MGRLSTWVQTGLAIALVVFALPAAAQITALQSGGGIIVYTNDDAPNGPIARGRGRFPVPDHSFQKSRFEPLVRQGRLVFTNQ
ncbi:MAG TPA: hypothetical protein VNJ12_10105 [Candidatus Dormibacteraeota bacterium]|nr:hypothetical protein [Candidatus Dormibacteraeota bacterium]